MSLLHFSRPSPHLALLLGFAASVAAAGLSCQRQSTGGAGGDRKAPVGGGGAGGDKGVPLEECQTVIDQFSDSPLRAKNDWERKGDYALICEVDDKSGKLVLEILSDVPNSDKQLGDFSYKFRGDPKTVPVERVFAAP